MSEELLGSLWLRPGGPGGAARGKSKPKERPQTTPEEDARIAAEHFTVSKWSSLDNYVCNVCSAGFLDKADAVDHWLAQHSGWTPPPATDMVDTGLVTPTGDHIVKEVVLPPDHDKEADE